MRDIEKEAYRLPIYKVSFYPIFNFNTRSSEDKNIRTSLPCFLTVISERISRQEVV